MTTNTTPTDALNEARNGYMKLLLSVAALVGLLLILGAVPGCSDSRDSEAANASQHTETL